MTHRKCGVALVLPICIVITVWFHLSVVHLDHIIPSAQDFDESLGTPPHIIERRNNETTTRSSAVALPVTSSNVSDSSPRKYNEQFWRTFPANYLSSVDSFTCCGLGHRMTRIVNAAHLASKLNYSLRIFWGFCENVEVFQHLFGPQPKEEMLNITSSRLFVRVHNEVPGYRKLVREGPDAPCQCTADKVAFDAKFYKGLRQRFRYKQEIDAFVEKAFSNHTVIGIHVRAGNGETGDFEKKGRVINDTDAWVDRVATKIQNMTQGWEKSPLLYIATDTPSMIDKFRASLAGVMSVMDYPQERKEAGGGVMFGESGTYLPSQKTKCLRGWDDMLRDMIVLSHADVLVAARPSSFTQTFPMSIVFDTPKESRSAPFPFCEFNLAGTDMRCFEEYLDWCCKGIGSFVFEGLNQRYDYVKVPHDYNGKIEPRRRTPNCDSTSTETKKRECLPYSWPTDE